MSRRHYRVRETGFSREPEFLEQSRTRTARYWRKFGKSLARRAFAGATAVVAAGAANLFTRVPDLDTSPPMTRNLKRPPLAGVYPVGAKKAKTNYDPSGSYVQYRKSKASVGTELGAVDKVQKLLYAHAVPVIDRFQNVTGIKTTGGAYNLTHFNDTTNSRYLFPYYLFELTNSFNLLGSNVQPTNTTADPYPFQRLSRLTTAGQRYNWAYQAGKTNADVAANNWQLERGPVLQTTQAVQRERNFIEWIDIRMLMYGARAAPTKIDVMIVQFNDEELVPEAVANVSGTGVSVIEADSGAQPVTSVLYNRWQTAWQGEVDNLLANPMSTRSLAEQSKFFKVKFHKWFEFNPTGAETDDNGHQVEFRLKYHMNKVIDYVAFPTEWDEVTAANEANPNIWPQYNEHLYSPFCKPKGREYLLIKALAPTTVTADADIANAASFDLMVRRKHTRMIR